MRHLLAVLGLLCLALAAAVLFAAGDKPQRDGETRNPDGGFHSFVGEAVFIELRDGANTSGQSGVLVHADSEWLILATDSPIRYQRWVSTKDWTTIDILLLEDKERLTSKP